VLQIRPSITGQGSAVCREGNGVGVGDILQGRFSLVALIGEGGMSRVFKAIDLRRAEAGSSDTHVAVKVLTKPFNEYFGSITALQREPISSGALPIRTSYA